MQILPLFPAGSSIDYDVEVKCNSSIIADLVIDYKNNFRKEQRTYYIEVELESSGDLEEKLRKYEDMLSEDDNDNNRLIVICKKKRQFLKVQQGKWSTPVKAIDINSIAEQWIND